jgi:predicted nucleic acid-binding Zn ribbon protein
MDETNKTLQIIYFGIGILSFILMIWLNYRRLEELEKNAKN